jgi:hypothetical protein
VTVRFAVDTDGSASRFTALTWNVPDDFLRSIARALQSCKWTPGADPDGVPVPIWVTMSIRFGNERT